MYEDAIGSAKPRSGSVRRAIGNTFGGEGAEEMVLPELVGVALIVVLVHQTVMLRAWMARSAASNERARASLTASQERGKRSSEELRTWREAQSKEQDTMRERREELRQQYPDNVARMEELLRLQREQLAVLKRIEAALASRT